MLGTNMKKYLTQISTFIKRYKVFLIFLTPLFVMVFLIPFFSSSPNGESQETIQSNITPTTTNSPIETTDAPLLDVDNHDHEPIDEDEKALIQREEVLKNGVTKYTLASYNPQRPNIRLIKDDNVLFSRVVISPDFPLQSSGFDEVYGDPERIIQGSRFYGVSVKTMIYSELGIANIIDPGTGLVLEQHIFQPMDVDQYIRTYGEDIPK